MKLSVVILAGGQGKRMRSTLPKVLHNLAGKPLLQHVIEATKQLPLATKPIVIFGYQGEAVKKALSDFDINWIHQPEQLGTGHAVQLALPKIQKDHQVLVLYGDVPLINIETLKKFIAITPQNVIGIITALLPNPSGLGRILRNQKNDIIDIIEQRDANDTTRQINEINTGIYLIPSEYLQKYLPLLTNKNGQQEFYLTDIIAKAVHDGIQIQGLRIDQHEEILGINTQSQLASLERYYQQKITELLMLSGVTLMDPARIDVRGDVEIGADTIVDVNVIFEGNVKIGKRCKIGANTIIKNATIEDDVEIRSHCIIEDSIIAKQTTIGPFARLRPGTILKSKSHVGNFVEIKNSEIGEGSKVNHLSYIGDSIVGMNVNVGAGVITCNYDGANKHQTIIKDYAFIGSNSQLIAPVMIGEGATIGAGSTITRNAPAHQLTLTRASQKSIENWQRPKKKEEA